MTGLIHAREYFPGAQLPETASLSAEASYWVCGALNRTGDTTNPESKWPYEMWHSSPSPVVLPCLKPGYAKIKRGNEFQAKAQECFYLGPAPNYPRDSVRMLTRHRTVLFTRSITWQRVSPASPIPAQTNDSLSTEEGVHRRRRERVGSKWWGGGRWAGRWAGRRSGSPEQPRRGVLT